MSIRVLNIKKKDTANYPDRKGSEEEITTDELYVAAISRGLDSAMLKTMTVGGLVDYVLTYNKMHGLDKTEDEPKERMATQADFDNF